MNSIFSCPISKFSIGNSIKTWELVLVLKTFLLLFLLLEKMDFAFAHDGYLPNSSRQAIKRSHSDTKHVLPGKDSNSVPVKWNTKATFDVLNSEKDKKINHCFQSNDWKPCISLINQELTELDEMSTQSSDGSIHLKIKQLIARRETELKKREAFHIHIISVVPGDLNSKGNSIALEDAQKINEQARLMKKYIEEFLNPANPDAKKMDPYIFTRSITIDPKSISHSYPNLTLNTKDTNDPRMVRSILNHENLHWFVGSDENKQNVDSAMIKLKQIGDLAEIPVPAGLSKFPKEKAREIVETHILVNWMELQANKDFMSDAEAKKLLGASQVYNTIYPRVIKHESEIGVVLRERGLMINRSELNKINRNHPVFKFKRGWS